MTRRYRRSPLRLCARCGRRSAFTFKLKTPRRRRYDLCGRCLIRESNRTLIDSIEMISESMQTIKNAIANAFGVPMMTIDPAVPWADRTARITLVDGQVVLQEEPTFEPSEFTVNIHVDGESPCD